MKKEKELQEKLESSLSYLTRIKEELQSQKEHNESIVHNIPSAILIFNDNLKLISANRSFYAQFKKSEELAGKHVHDVIPQSLIQNGFDTKLKKRLREW